MSLETPDRIRASAVLLFQNYDVPNEETVEFRGSNGFSSVAFLDPSAVDLGIVLQMELPVSPDEGAVYVGGDLFVDFEGFSSAFITPLATDPEDAIINALPDFSVVIPLVDGAAPAWRLYVTVFRIAFAGEPVEQVSGS